jgi:hypothetical protein
MGEGTWDAAARREWPRRGEPSALRKEPLAVAPSTLISAWR